MKAIIILTIILWVSALIVAALVQPAHAASNCAPRDRVAAGLAANYNETLVAIGISAGGYMIEVYASPSGSWTIMQTSPEGVSCLASSGGAFEQVTEGLPPAGIPG